MSEEVKIEGNIDINEALKEFEAKSGTQEAQNNLEISQTPQIPRMARWVMKLSGGTIKEQKTAEYVLLGFVVIAISISLFLFFGGSSVKIKQPTPEMLNLPQPNEGFIPS